MRKSTDKIHGDKRQERDQSDSVKGDISRERGSSDIFTGEAEKEKWFVTQIPCERIVISGTDCFFNKALKLLMEKRCES